MGPNPVSFVLRSLSCSILFLSLSYNFPTVESQFAGIVTVFFLPFFETIILLYFSFSSFSPCLLSTSSLLLYPPKCESMRLHVLGLLCPLGSAQLLRVCGVRTSRCRSGRSGGLGVALLLLLLPQLLTNGSRGKQSPACLILPDYLAPPPPPLHPSWFSRHGRCQHQVRRHTLRRNSKEAGERKIDEAQVVRAECIFSHLLICMNKISLFFFFPTDLVCTIFFPASEILSIALTLDSSSHLLWMYFLYYYLPSKTLVRLQHLRTSSSFSSCTFWREKKNLYSYSQFHSTSTFTFPPHLYLSRSPSLQAC